MNRQGFIGGSDMRRIMDGDWVSLWEEKTGRTQPEDLSNHLAVQLGTYTEDFLICNGLLIKNSMQRARCRFTQQAT